jgi:hypothetical protein
MKYEYSLLNYLSIWGKIIASYLVIIFIFALTTDIHSDPLWSYCTLAIASIIGLRLFYSFFLRDIGFSGFWVIAAAFFFKLIFGTWHFLTFVQPDYFNGNTTYKFFDDYYWMHESIQYLAVRANEVGFGNALNFDFFIENKGAVIFYTYSPIYYIGGDLVLNLCHISTLYTLFTAVLTTYIAKNFFNLNKKQLFATLVLTAFFPFGLITSMTMRDFAGQFLIALGLISLQYSFKNPRLFGLLFISSILFFFQRKNYVVIPLITYAIFLIFYTKESGLKRFKSGFNFRILFLIFAISFGYSYYKIATQTELIDTDTQLNSSYTADITQLQFYLLLPVYIFKGFLGPFPWTQFFNYTQETIFQLSDYFTSTFLFTIILTLWLKRKEIKSFKEDINLITIASLFLSFAGIASGFMHLVYIALSVIFLIPFIMRHVSFGFFMKKYLIVLVFLIFLTVMWVALGLQGGGTWSNFKN